MCVAEVMITDQTLANFGSPTNRDYESVASCFDEEAPLCVEKCYIEQKHDIVTLKLGGETTWLDMAVEKLLQKTSCRLTRARHLINLKVTFQLIYNQVYLLSYSKSRLLSMGHCPC